jgi:dTDP-4-dehydrorhamnose reductase
MRPNILVAGKNGQLGSELQDLAKNNDQFNFIFTDRTELDITDEKALNFAIKEYNPKYFINCTAYTAVDRAETDRENAYKVNAAAMSNLALTCKEYSVILLHVSTDYVFNGNATVPYREEQPTDPVNYYGYTKRAGEELVLEGNPASVIIRTSWVYSHYGNNFVKTMLRLMKERNELSIVSDQQGSPTYARDLAAAIVQVIEKLEEGKVENPFGIYHYSNEGIISWHDFAQAIREQKGFNCTVHAIPTSAYPTPAKRPAYSGLDKEKIQQVFGIVLQPWRNSLEVCLSKLQ